MELPKNVKIGYATYKIIDWDPEIADASGHFGMIRYAKREIKIDTSHGDIKTANTLLHEIIHGVHYSMSMSEVEKWGKEYLTCIHADGLMQVFLDNPKVVDVISAAIATYEGR